jgi:hypothetical protein
LRIHRRREGRTFRHRLDPDEFWRCCAAWPRTLINKWNGREFAERHGCLVPELYWWGSDPARAPIESLPDHFVVRPVFGTVRRGVQVVADGWELLRNQPASAAEVRDRLPRRRRFRPHRRLLIEEFVRSEDGELVLPIEYKCHTFGDTVAAVQATKRTGAHEATHRFYTPDWEPLADPMSVAVPLDDRRDPPGCLDQMVSQAMTLGAEIGTYMRIDFFATDRGCVFNEFASLPGGGRGFTPYADELFGALWAARFPSAV